MSLNPYTLWRDEYLNLLDPDFYTADWLDFEVARGAIKPWSNERAGILTKLKQYPTGLVEIHGMAAAGELEAILELIAEAEEWGRSIGCSVACIESRPGWARVLKDYRVNQVSIMKDLR